MTRETNTHVTPLLALLRELGDDARRADLAEAAGTSPGYLYQLATCIRRSCRVQLAQRIEDASRKMSLLYGTRVVTMQEVASMCPLPSRD